MTAGEQFTKMIRPVGCVLFILVLVLFLILAFTSGGKALDIGDYAPPEMLDRSDADALAAEIEENILPHLPGEGHCRVENGKLYVELSGEQFAACRATILEYYPKCDIQFVRITD